MVTGAARSPQSGATARAWSLLEEGVEEERAHRLLDEAEAWARDALERGVDDPVLRTDLAAVHALRGDTDAAVRWLERAYEAGEWNHRLLRRDARFDAVADDPRFQAVLESMTARAARQRARVEAEEAVEAGGSR